MKIVIVGAGAVGSLFAALLAKGGEDVVMIERDKKTRRAIEAHGLRYDGTGGEQRLPVPVYESVPPDSTADLALVCVRSSDTDSVVEAVRHSLARTGFVVCFQVGLGRIEPLREGLGDERVFAGWTNMGATLMEAGHVLHTSWGDTRVAPCAPAQFAAAETIAAQFTRLGIKSHATPDITRLLWTRTVIHAGFHAIAAIAQISNEKILQIEDARELMRAAIAEAVAVTNAAGIHLLVDSPVAEVERILEMTSGHLCPMLQDLYRKRPIEVDVINGAIVELARAHGLAAPIHETLCRLARTVERARLES